MNQVDPQSLVESYEELVSALALPDQADRHVLAAAIVAKASVIVTFNLSDFPKAALSPFRVRAVHPDAFLLSLLKQEPAAFLEGLRKHRAWLHHPPKTSEQYLEGLRRTGFSALRGVSRSKTRFRPTSGSANSPWRARGPGEAGHR